MTHVMILKNITSINFTDLNLKNVAYQFLVGHKHESHIHIFDLWYFGPFSLNLIKSWIGVSPACKIGIWPLYCTAHLKLSENIDPYTERLADINAVEEEGRKTKRYMCKMSNKCGSLGSNEEVYTLFLILGHIICGYVVCIVSNNSDNCAPYNIFKQMFWAFCKRSQRSLTLWDWMFLILLKISIDIKQVKRLVKG